MRFVLLLVLAFVSQIGIAQNKIYFDEDWLETSKKKAMYYRVAEPQGELFLIKDYFMNGDLQFEALSKKEKEPFHLVDTAIWYYENGQIQDKAFYEENVVTGRQTSFYSNGVVKRETNFKNEIPHGEYIEYFPSGALSGYANYKEGELDGLFLTYSAEGVVRDSVVYEDGVLNGPYRLYTRGDLFAEGNIKNGKQDGPCKEYYYDTGELRYVYTIVDEKIHGDYIQYTDEGDTATHGYFDEGVAQYFSDMSLSTTNNSKFSTEMILKDGVEQWTMFRDGNRVAEYYFKKGKKHGLWKLYTWDGKHLFETKDYKKAVDCSEEHAQGPEEFRPNLFLSDRFMYESDALKEDYCEGVEIESLYERNEDISYNDHPIYYYLAKEHEVDIVQDRTNTFFYEDAANDADFIKKNNCEPYESSDAVTLCTREVFGKTYFVYTSEDVTALIDIKKNATPKDNEIVFCYQTFEERVYREEERGTFTRYMSFKIPAVIKEAIVSGIMDDSEIVRALEHEIFSVSSFSGLSAFDALEKELEK